MLSISAYGETVGYQIAWVALGRDLPARVHRDQEPVGRRVAYLFASAPDFRDRQLLYTCCSPARRPVGILGRLYSSRTSDRDLR